MAIKTISQFDAATPTKSDRILIEQNGEGKNTVLIDCIYPVGTIYLSLKDVSPSSFIGGTWERLPEGKALWTASSGLSIKDNSVNTINAGLPNITGDTVFNIRGSAGDYTAHMTPVPSGNNNAFSSFNSKEGSNALPAGFTVPDSRPHLLFNASKSNPIYGNSPTVQPPAYKVYAWKRIA